MIKRQWAWNKAAETQDLHLFARPSSELSTWDHVILISQLEHFLDRDYSINNTDTDPEPIEETFNNC